MKDFNVWGLTGGIASGKSTVGQVFSEFGVSVIDADQIAKELSRPGGKAHPLIVGRFGTAHPKELREIIFHDRSARAELQAILHPLIWVESQKLIDQLVMKARKRPLNLIYEATLLVETGRYRDFSGLIVVEAPLELRRLRLIARDGISEELAQAIFASQISDEERRVAATFVIINSGSRDELREQVQKFVSTHGWK